MYVAPEAQGLGRSLFQWLFLHKYLYTSVTQTSESKETSGLDKICQNIFIKYSPTLTAAYLDI